MACLQKTSFYICFLVSIFSVVLGRPQTSWNSDSNVEYDPRLMNVALGSYYSYPSQIMLDNGVPLDNLIPVPNPDARQLNVIPLDGFMKMAKAKRQVKYRQCYFNPISCFKK